MAAERNPKESVDKMRFLRFRSKCGITLIELMTAVVIIGIVTALAAPTFDRTIQRIKFRGQTKDMVSTLRTARSLAITEKASYGVHFDYEARIISLFKDLSSLPNYSFDPGADSVARADTLPTEYEYLFATFDNSSVVFQPNGSASGTGSIYLLWADDVSVNFSHVHVLASTGRTKILSIYNY